MSYFKITKYRDYTICKSNLNILLKNIKHKKKLQLELFFISYSDTALLLTTNLKPSP